MVRWLGFPREGSIEIGRGADTRERGIKFSFYRDDRDGAKATFGSTART